MYLKKTWRAGATIEVKKTYSARYGKKMARGDNIAETTDAQKRVNMKNAIDELRRILNANFQPGDWHAIFNYPMKRAPSVEEAIRDRDRLLREMRRIYREHGVELKRVSTLEIGGRPHHHMVINALPGGMAPVKKAWRRILADTYYTEEERKNIRLMLIEEAEKALFHGGVESGSGESRCI